MTRVSVVTVSFNQAQFLERAIRSVLDQDHDDIEYIVVDPGSTDGSRDIIARYRDRIAEVIREPDRGPADGLNKGFAAATGDIYAYLNADDAFLAGAIRAAVAAFDRHPDAGIVAGHGYIVDAAGKVVRRFRSAPFTPWRFVHGAATVMQQSTFFRASAFNATTGFNLANRTSWDAELLLDMALAGARVRIAQGYWSLFTVHPDSITGSRRRHDEYLVDRRRWFRRVTGREQRTTDRLVLFPLARLLRWLGDPRGLWERSKDWFAATPAVPAEAPPLRRDLASGSGTIRPDGRSAADTA